jgi:hypothetical protein
LAAVSTVVRKSPGEQDCVVADAVTIEPVSIAKFPANREINREFHQIRPLCKILKVDARANSKASSEIPYATEQGIFVQEQRNLTQQQGIRPGFIAN